VSPSFYEQAWATSRHYFGTILTGESGDRPIERRRVFQSTAAGGILEPPAAEAATLAAQGGVLLGRHLFTSKSRTYGEY
jgi:hypothetical protein